MFIIEIPGLIFEKSVERWETIFYFNLYVEIHRYKKHLYKKHFFMPIGENIDLLILASNGQYSAACLKTRHEDKKNFPPTSASYIQHSAFINDKAKTCDVSRCQAQATRQASRSCYKKWWAPGRKSHGPVRMKKMTRARSLGFARRELWLTAPDRLSFKLVCMSQGRNGYKAVKNASPCFNEMLGRIKLRKLRVHETMRTDTRNLKKVFTQETSIFLCLYRSSNIGEVYSNFWF